MCENVCVRVCCEGLKTADQVFPTPTLSLSRMLHKHTHTNCNMWGQEIQGQVHEIGAEESGHMTEADFIKRFRRLTFIIKPPHTPAEHVSVCVCV